MSHRVTVMINDDVMKKARNLQSKMIKESETTISFSKVVNAVMSGELTL